MYVCVLTSSSIGKYQVALNSKKHQTQAALVMIIKTRECVLNSAKDMEGQMKGYKKRFNSFMN